MYADCPATEVAYSDYHTTGSISGFVEDDTIEITCIEGYSGGGLYSTFSLFLSIYLSFLVHSFIHSHSFVKYDITYSISLSHCLLSYVVT